MVSIAVCVVFVLFGEVTFCQEDTNNPEYTTGIVTPSTTTTSETPSSGENGHNATSEEYEAFEERLERSKNNHLWLLRHRVLASLGWSSPPNIDYETKMRLLSGMRSTPVYVTRQKYCYFPLCDLPMLEMPEYMNRSLWFDTSSRNIRYFFNIPTDSDPNLEVTSAVIKLHLKRREDCQYDCGVVSDCPCAYEDTENSSSRLHIKVYQYKKPIRSHARLRHSNMRLIDARMVTWDSERWVSLQVTEPVKRIMTRGRRNGGFEVHVRDMEENILDAKTVIDPTVCSSIPEYDCTPSSEGYDDSNDDEQDDPNYSPVLEISTTLTTAINIP